ncbi:MAG TPA: GTP-binding protein, partial [Vulgatibacter sp.]
MLPVVVLTGFLGSGKTTLLRDLLAKRDSLRIGLVQNELGQAGIDVGTPATRSMIELTEGCVCCLRNPDLLQAMEELHARGDLDRVILETTGLADPLPLTWTLARPELQDKIRLDSVVTVVDPINHEAAAGEEWEAQVRCGDVIVLSKLDLATPAQKAAAIDAIRRVNPDARILEAGPHLPEGLLLDTAGPLRGAPREERARSGRHSDFGVVSLAHDGRHTLDALEDLLEALPPEVFRAKGIARIEDGSWVSFHVVGSRLQIHLDAPAPAHGESRFAFFGRGLSQEAIEAMLAPTRAR